MLYASPYLCGIQAHWAHLSRGGDYCRVGGRPPVEPQTRMKILQVNKFLFGKGGAETVMFRTADLLCAHGHEVSYFAMQDERNLACDHARYFPRGRYYDQNHGLVRRTRDAGASVYSFEARRALRGLLSEHTPDLAHLHNVYHQLTLSIVEELSVRQIPIVVTLHDYKAVCPNYLAYTKNAPCRRCVGRHPGHAVVHRCIKSSRAASIVAAVEAMVVRYRHLYDRVDAFIAPSQHLATMMVEGGLCADRIHVVPNFVADEQLAAKTTTSAGRRPLAIFVGRLEEVKGVRVLLDAARLLAGECEIAIVGQGPLDAAVKAAASEGLVRYLGRQAWPSVARLMDEAQALVVPSIWEENCPMVILEAGARGCAVIASRRGGLTELVSPEQDGLLVAPGDAEALARAIRRLCEDPSRSAELGRARYARTLARHTAGAHLPALMSVYERAMEGASTDLSTGR